MYSVKCIKFLQPIGRYLKCWGIIPCYDFENGKCRKGWPPSTFLSILGFILIFMLTLYSITTLLLDIKLLITNTEPITKFCAIFYEVLGISCIFASHYDAFTKTSMWEEFFHRISKMEQNNKYFRMENLNNVKFYKSPLFWFVLLNCSLLGGYVLHFVVYFNIGIFYLSYVCQQIFSYENMLVSFTIASLTLNLKSKFECIDTVLEKSYDPRKEKLHFSEVKSARKMYLEMVTIIDFFNILFGRQMFFMPLLCSVQVLHTSLIISLLSQEDMWGYVPMHCAYAMFLLVLEEIRDEFFDFRNSGMSITEISHRSQEYADVNNETLLTVRELLSVPSNYKILLVPGGGQGAFAAIPMNLMNKSGSADYVVAGIWSQIAAHEAAKFGKVNLVFPKPEKPYQIPDQKMWKLDTNASYLFYCDNETIEGVEFPYIPTPPEGVPLVVDMSSNIMTKNIDVSKFGVIFAAAQKNIGTAGIALVIIREDLLGNPAKNCPNIMNFTAIAKENSILNTPPIFPVYVVGKVLKWIQKYGGLDEMEKQCIAKSKILYETVQNSNGFYSCVVEEGWRSRINVSLRIGGLKGDDHLEALFLKEAQERKMYQLKGHKLVGGIRVSLYNAVSLDNLKELVRFMEDFRRKNLLL